VANLQSNYMGIPLKNPFIVGACSMTAHMDSIKRMEDAGAGAIVIQSLFEEQIQLQQMRLEEELTVNDNLDAEIQDLFPEIEHGGPEEHLMWVRKTKEAVSIPVIGSLNCTNPRRGPNGRFVWKRPALTASSSTSSLSRSTLSAAPLRSRQSRWMLSSR
jgi:dihydroorotate dehydrogenase (fumarate)